MHPQYEQFNPFRSPQWRADRALMLSAAQPRRLRPTRDDDEYVRGYAKFLRRYLPLIEDEAGRLELYPANPGLYYAQNIHFYADAEWRTILQARLLTGEDPTRIARRMGTLPSTVEWYEHLFFNVLDRLDCHDWVVKTVLGTAMDRAANRDGTITEHQRNLVYKLFGYYGGPLVLDVMISGFNRGTLPTRASEIAGWYDTTVKNLLRSRAAAAARVFEVNRFNVMQLFELHLAVVNADVQAQASSGGPKNTAEKGLQMLLKSVPWSLAQDNKSNLNETEREFSRSHIEPTAHERLLISATGQAPATLLERVTKHDPALVAAAVEEEVS